MKLLQKTILVRETMVSKTSSLHLTEKDKKDVSNFDVTREIIGMSDSAAVFLYDAKIGDTPIFSNHTQPLVVRVIEKTDTKVVAELIFDAENLVAVESKEI